jgi:heme ABC exporter ATP-binding subunit CcmA
MSAPGASASEGRGLSVRVDRVSRRFGAVAALADVVFDVPAGQSILLLGANGAGKSTLLRIVAGLIRPTSGAVTFGDAKATPASPAARAAVGYLGHKSLLHDYLTAHENLALYARLYGAAGRDAEDRAERWLAAVGLERAAHRPVRGFSRGMFQRLALARALIHEPRLLLLDEPASGLDTEGRARLADVVQGLRRSGVTMMHVSHHAESAVALADRVIVLQRGRLVEDAPSGEHGGAEWVARAAPLRGLA